MSTVVPAVPSFTLNDSSLTNLQNLSSCVRFLTGDLLPQWHTYIVNSRTLTTSQTWTTINFAPTQPGYDSEVSGAMSTGILSDLIGATIRTQGIYAVEACANFQGQSSAYYGQLSFQITGGGNNPNLALNSTIRFGLRGQETAASTSNQTAVCVTDTTPIVVYPLDTIRVQAWGGVSSVVIQPNNNAAYNEGRFSTNFTGRWKHV